MKRVVTVILFNFLFFSLHAITYTVNTLDNTDDGVCDSGHCSLREAINAANGNAGLDQIDFSVTGTIDLSGGALPIIVDPVDISGAGITLSASITHGLDFNAGSANSVVDGLTITSSSVHGIIANSSDNLMITNCDISLNGTVGAPIGSSFGNGISLFNCAAVTISGCTLNSNRENGIYMEMAAGSSISNNMVSGSGFHGIILIQAGNSTISTNTSNGNGVAAPTSGGFDSSSGIIIVNCDNTLIDGNTCNSSSLEGGIFLAGSSSCTVTNNTACMNYLAGFVLEGSSDNTFSGNTACNNMGSGSASGFFLGSGSQNNTIQNNTMNGNECAGVRVDGGSGNQIIENTMFDNACIGIELVNGGNNNFPAPVICAITATEISGTVTEASTLHVYVADPDDPCQGQTLVGSIMAGPGNWTFPGTFNPALTYAVTATNSGDNTSEFACDVGISNVMVSNDGPVCEGGTLLLSASGGTSYQWSGPNSFSSSSQNPSIPNISLAGDGLYSVSITSGVCTAVFTTDVEVLMGADAGTNGAAQVCNSGSTIVNLFGSLGGTPDGGGTWVDNNGSGVSLATPTSVDFSGVPAGTYNFTYNVVGDPMCPPASATIMVAVSAAPDAGISNTATFCTDATVDLPSILLGTPDGGGTWSDDNGAGVNLANPNNVDFTGVPVGDYDFTYTISGNAPCPDASATVTVSISGAPDAGTDGSASICNGGSTILDLFAQLGGTPDMGGTWSDDNGSGVNLSNPNSVDFDGVIAGTYAFTYLIMATSPSCSDASAVVTVTVADAPDAGTNGTLDICNTSTVDLFSGLGGTPAPGGTWNDDNGAGVNLGNPNAVDFNGIMTGTYNFTYTVSGTPPCTNSSAVVTVTVSAAANAGMDGVAAVCNAGTTIVDLPGSLNGTPDAGGTWSDDNGSGVNLGNPSAVDFTGVAAGSYVFTYTIPASGLCPASSAMVTVTVSAAPDAGMDASATVCSDGTLDFFASLNGTPQPGGTWTDNDGSGVNLTNPNSVSFAGVTAGTYTYTYMIAGSPPCSSSSATLTVTVDTPPNAGMDGSATVCNGGVGTTIDLVSSLGGTPDAGGTWSDDSGSGVNLSNPNAVDFNGIPAGTYVFTYTIPGAGVCPGASATVTITVNNEPNAGQDNAIEVCEDDIIDFVASLNGTPDIGGIWTDDDGSGVNLSNPNAVNFSGVFAGTYTFTYSINGTPPCGSSSATLTVTVFALPDAGTNGFVSTCFSASFSPVNLFGSLGGTPDFGGTWADDDFTGVNLSDPQNVDFSGVPPGTYTFTYTVATNPVCPSSSSMVTVTIDPAPNAGSDGALELCESSTPTNTNLFAALNGTPDFTGTFSDDNGTGVNLSDPFSVNFAGIAPGNYQFTYTVPGGAGCPNATAVAFVIISAAPNAGADNILDLCEADNNNAINLFGALGGMPDLGGFWTDNDFSGVDLSDPFSVDFTILPVGLYEYTYTVNSSNPVCPNATASVFVNIEPAPNAGTGGSATTCNVGTPVETIIDLFALLSDNPNATGTWTDNDGAGVDLSDPTMVDFSGTTEGTYTFTYLVNSSNSTCAGDQAIVTILVEDCSCPGVSTVAPPPLCNDVGELDLTTLEINTDPGTWSITSTPPGSAPAELFGSLFVASFADTGFYTITFTLDETPMDPGCPESSSQTLEVLPFYFAGVAVNSIKTCNSDGLQVDLIDLLDFEDSNGTWTVSNGSLSPEPGAFDAAAGTFNTDNHPAGTFFFDYSFPGNAACDGSMATVEVTIDAIDLVIEVDNVITCAGENTGSVIAVPVGGQGGVVYSWADIPDDIPTREDLGAGTYELTITDAAGCEASGSVTLTEPDAIQLTCNQSSPTSGPIIMDGSAIITFTGGVEPYVLEWGGAGSGTVAVDTSGEFMINNLEVGEYGVTITDANDCQGICAFNIESVPCPPNDSTFISQTTCDPAAVDTIITILEDQIGCDSVIVLTVDLLPSNTMTFDFFTCDEDMPELVQDTFMNQFGCDSIIIQTFTYVPPDTTEVSVVTCQPDDAGIFTDVLMNSAGCDSVIITKITFDATDVDTTMLSFLTCEESMAGVVQDTFLNQFGCDSIVIETTTYSPPDTTELMEVSCQPEDAGTFTEVLTNQLGCDSVIITTITFDATDIDTTMLSFLTCEESMAGVVQDTFLNQFGCDSIVIETTMYSPPDTTELMEVSCQPEDAGTFTEVLTNQLGCDSVIITTITFDATDIDTTLLSFLTCEESMAGVVQDTFLNQFGCDSIVIETTMYSPPDTTELMEVSCQPEDAGTFTEVLTNQLGCDSVIITTITFDATDIDTTLLSFLTCEESMAGIVQDTFLNQFGCDSIVIETTTYSPPDTTELMEVSCQPEDAGTFTEVLTNQLGCDSVIITTVTFDPTGIDETTLEFLTCDEAQAGTIRDTLTNQIGCDSIIIQNFTYSPPDTTLLSDTSCNPTEVGDFTEVLTNQLGCDSVIITTVTFDPTGIDETTLEFLTCDEAQAGTIRDTLTNQIGCDSIIIQNFTYSPPDTTLLSDTSCNPTEVGDFTEVLTNQLGCDSVIITTVTFDPTGIDETTLEFLTCDEAQAGTIRDTLTNQIGCDSIIIQNFTYSPPDTTLLSDTSCNPTEVGDFTEVLTNQLGCDSVIITTVTFDPTGIDETTLEFLTCDEAQAGTIRDTLTNQIGCDSIIIQNFTYSPPDTMLLSDTSCNPTEVGDFTEVLTNQLGCDSVIITTVTFDPTGIDETTLEFLTCDEAQAGTIRDTLTNQIGCDSIIIQNFTYSPPDTTLLSDTSCNPTEVGDFTEVLTNQLGCDSVIITTVTFDPTGIDETTLEFLTCDEAQAGTIRDTLTNQIGCDSIIIQNFTYSPPDTTLLSDTSCNPTEVGDFTEVLTNQLGCDSVIITTVTFDPDGIDMIMVEIETCDEAMAGTVQDTLTNQLGCDSIIIQTFNYVPIDTSFVQETTCVEEEAGIFEEVLISAEGCDSVVVSEVIWTSFNIMAEGDLFEADENGVVSDNLSFNDLTEGNTIYTVATPPEAGLLNLSVDGSFVFEATPDQIGEIGFSYQVCSADCPETCDTASVILQVFPEEIDVPNAFSPNGDGTNETFFIPGLEQFEDPRLIIVNRWGAILFEAQPYGNDWDGTNEDGNPLPEGTYYYVLWLDLDDGVQMKGSITIIR